MYNYNVPISLLISKVNSITYHMLYTYFYPRKIMFLNGRFLFRVIIRNPMETSPSIIIRYDVTTFSSLKHMYYFVIQTKFEHTYTLARRSVKSTFKYILSCEKLFDVATNLKCHTIYYIYRM